jgi:hypothetical protein
MPKPKVVVTFTDEAGATWEVYDVAFGPPLAEPGKRKVLPHGDPRARYRLFVPPPPERMLRSFTFAAGGSDRGLAPETLREQLQAASYSPKKPQQPAPSPPGTKLGQ